MRVTRLVASFASASLLLLSSQVQAVPYDINLVGSLTATGSLGFAGDLTTDGTIGLSAGDISAFSLMAGGRTWSFADLVFGTDPQYTVFGGELTEIDLIAENPQGDSFVSGSPNAPITTNVWEIISNSDPGPACEDIDDGVFLCQGSYTLTSSNPPPDGSVPEPGVISLLGLGLISIGFFGRRKVR